MTEQELQRATADLIVRTAIAAQRDLDLRLTQVRDLPGPRSVLAQRYPQESADIRDSARRALLNRGQTEWARQAQACASVSDWQALLMRIQKSG